MKRGFCVFLFAMFLITTSSFSYTVILKNGKTIEGTLVEQTDDLIVLRDASGIKMDFKKASVDLPKTEVANQKKDTPSVSTVKEESSAAQSQPSVDASKPKKPAKVLNEADIERLRKKYDLGQGMISKDSVQPSEQDTDAQEEASEKSEADWKWQSIKVSNDLRQAESNYNLLNQKCQELKGITVQTHILVDENGRPLDMVATTKEICDDAGQAKQDLEQAKSDRQDFEEKARQEGVPPGWLGTEDHPE
jgi:hypothetical protein